MRHHSPGNSIRCRRAAFTLVEIVVALTVMAVIAAVAIPAMKGLNSSEKARQPVESLAALVQEVRHRAMKERRSYQIVFEPSGIHASPAMYPYEKLEDFMAELTKMRTPPDAEQIQRSGVERQEIAGRQPLANSVPEPEEQNSMPWTVTIPLEKGMECEVLMWGDGEWDVLDGSQMRRWVFQPAGMSNPARIRLRHEGTELEAGFDALTGELITERTVLPASQP